MSEREHITDGGHCWCYPEVIEVTTRVASLQRLVDRLQRERDEWESQALLADAEIKRLRNTRGEEGDD